MASAPRAAAVLGQLAAAAQADQPVPGLLRNRPIPLSKRNVWPGSKSTAHPAVLKQ